MESQSHSARIKYSVTSIHLGCCSYCGNIRLVLGLGKRNTVNTDRELSSTAVAHGSMCTFALQHRRLNLKCWPGRQKRLQGCFSHSSDTQSVSRGAGDPGRCVSISVQAGEDEPSTELELAAQSFLLYHLTKQLNLCLRMMPEGK